jgi:hypothetical protein
VSSADRLPASLPAESGYTQLLGVPMDVVERLRSLHLVALDGGLPLQTWSARHAETLAGVEPDADPAGLELLTEQVGAAAAAASDDFERWLFLVELQQDLQLLQAPDPARELQRLHSALPAPTAEQPRSQAERHLHTLRALAGLRTQDEPYEPGTRMIKALRVGTLEETYRWLQAAVADHPGASVQDLLTRAAVEVADAKLELDRYDTLRDRPDQRTAQ